MTIHSMLRPGLAALTLVALLSAGTALQADEFTAPLTALGEGEIAAFASDPILINAIIAQNAVTAS